MAFVFVHTADWQIGKPYAGFVGDLGARLRQARLDTVDSIADVAAKAGAAHVLVAGDVFDGPTPPAKTVGQLIAKLKTNAQVVWHLLPGNHDPLRAGSVWESLAAAGLPENVRLHLKSEAAAIAAGVALLPAPLRQASSALDPTEWMDRAETAPGVLRIGLAHGSVQGNFGGTDGDAAVPIAPDRARRARLDYLALGDWHGTIRIDDRTWYAGTPEVDRYPDNEPGHVLVVAITAPDRPPQIVRHRTSQFTWLQRQVRLTAASELDTVAEAVARMGRAAQTTLMRLSLAGAVHLNEHAALTSRLEHLASSLAHLDPDLSALAILADDDDIASLGDGTIRAVATQLKAMAASDGEPGVTARRALMLLASYVTADARSR